MANTASQNKSLLYLLRCLCLDRGRCLPTTGRSHQRDPGNQQHYYDESQRIADGDAEELALRSIFASNTEQGIAIAMPMPASRVSVCRVPLAPGPGLG
jgi:hypothetical protein